MGAIITSLVSTYRNRVQPIGRSVEIIPVFQKKTSDLTSDAQITIVDDQNEYQFHNLYVARIQLVNRGNQDFSEFTFGLALADRDQIISTKYHTKDRHHEVVQLSELSLDNPQSELDLILKPFNRNDSYSIDLAIVIPPIKESPGEFLFSSPHSIRFTDVSSMKDLLIEMIEDGILMGPLKIAIKRLD